MLGVYDIGIMLHERRAIAGLVISLVACHKITNIVLFDPFYGKTNFLFLFFFLPEIIRRIRDGIGSSLEL